MGTGLTTTTLLGGGAGGSAAISGWIGTVRPSVDARPGTCTSLHRPLRLPIRYTALSKLPGAAAGIERIHTAGLPRAIPILTVATAADRVSGMDGALHRLTLHPILGLLVCKVVLAVRQAAHASAGIGLAPAHAIDLFHDNASSRPVSAASLGLHGALHGFIARHIAFEHVHIGKSLGMASVLLIRWQDKGQAARYAIAPARLRAASNSWVVATSRRGKNAFSMRGGTRSKSPTKNWSHRTHMAILNHSINTFISVDNVRVGDVLSVVVGRVRGVALAAISAVTLDPGGGARGLVPHNGRMADGGSDPAAVHPHLPRCLPTADASKGLRPRGGGSAGTLSGQAVGTSPRERAARSAEDDAQAVVRAGHAMPLARHNAQQERLFGSAAKGMSHRGGDVGLGGASQAARAPPKALLVLPNVPALAADRRAFPRRRASDHALPRHRGEGCHGGRNGPKNKCRSLAVRLELLDLGGRRRVVQLQRHFGSNIRLVIAYCIAALVSHFHMAPYTVCFDLDDAGAASPRLCP